MSKTRPTKKAKKKKSLQMKTVGFPKGNPDLLIVRVECETCGKLATFSEHGEDAIESAMLGAGWSGDMGMMLCPRCDDLYTGKNWHKYGNSYVAKSGEYYDI